MSKTVAGFIQLAAVVAFIVLSLIASKALEAQKKPPSTNTAAERVLVVDAVPLEKTNYRIEFDTTAVIEAYADIDVVPEVSGRIEYVSPAFYEGGEFKKGDILFQVVKKDFELEVDRLQGLVAAAQTTLKLEEARRDSAVAEWKQVHGLNKDVPPLVAREPQVKEALLGLIAAEAQYNNAILDLQRTTFTLPFDGRVLSSQISVGSYVSAGQSVGQVIDKARLEVKASLQKQELDWLITGSIDENGDVDPDAIMVEVETDGRIKRYKGCINRLASSFDTRTRLANVTFGVCGDLAHVLPGSFAKVFIKGPVIEQAYAVPISALQKGGYIWGVNGGNTLSHFKPDILHSDDERVVFKADDLVFSKVITSKLSGPADGMVVNVRKSDETLQGKP